MREKSSTEADLVEPRRATVGGALVCTALVFGLWTAYVATLYPRVAGVESLVLRVALNDAIRIAIFLGPVVGYLLFVARERPLRALRLTTNVPRGLAWGVAGGVALGAVIVARAALFGPRGLDPKPVPLEAWLTALTVATIVEEIVFRGFLLRRLEGATGFWWANVVTAALFVAIHVPGWALVGGTPLVPGRLMAMGDIFVLGLVLGYVFERSGSVWAPFVVHSVNNALATVFFS